ncbi:N-formylglutamate amidohydrolase, partial [Streptomyces bacillaris]
MSPASQPSFRLHPGSPDSPVLLHVPHGSRTVRDDVRGGIVLDDSALE